MKYCNYSTKFSVEKVFLQICLHQILQISVSGNNTQTFVELIVAAVLCFTYPMWLHLCQNCI